jgi:hypothetical protein
LLANPTRRGSHSLDGKPVARRHHKPPWHARLAPCAAPSASRCWGVFCDGSHSGPTTFASLS